MNESDRKALLQLGLVRDTDDGGPPPPEVCETCGQKIRKLNPHRMDRSKWRVLDSMAQLHSYGTKAIKVEHGRGLVAQAGNQVVTVRDGDGNRLGHIERHVGRLVWFGLVVRVGKRRSGLYRVTEDGYKFLAGAITVPDTVYCRDGKVEEVSEERVSVSEVRGVVLDKAYWDRYAEHQIARPPPGRIA